MDEILYRIAKLIYQTKNGNDMFDDEPAEYREKLIREAHYAIFKNERVMSDPYIVIRDFKGNQIGKRHYDADTASQEAHKLMEADAALEGVDIVEVLERRLTGFHEKVTREVIKE